MQYTAEGRDLLGAFTRATFCTVVSSSPGERGAVRLQATHPQKGTAPGQACCPHLHSGHRWALTAVLWEERHQAHFVDEGNGDSKKSGLCQGPMAK